LLIASISDSMALRRVGLTTMITFGWLVPPRDKERKEY